ncbi:MAG: hypothetical protein OXC03_02905 [Flavobacteriaceae bacterium]|nr:hypothetical protein [Flavobacteriaceae bacterium]
MQKIKEFKTEECKKEKCKECGEPKIEKCDNKNCKNGEWNNVVGKIVLAHCAK